ncbi:replication initiator protein [Peromfec virus RodF8_43]|uniref:Replication initiator protein n=1 Tax=Peromfec virus RodF8_43 TaxID=2929376 RepID=A0A976R7Q4_9VIRU|nr:replication initiator protein [Peromfec virus RodF8_43]
MKGFILGTKPNGKRDIKITPYSVSHIESINGRLFFYSDYLAHFSGSIKYRDYLDIPCGKCLACRLDKARDWATRIMLENSECDESCFITLTYDDVHVPRTCYAEPVNGEVVGDAYTLSKRDLQLFLKRLRKYLSGLDGSPSIKFFACGEYGDTTARPHYHVIILGWKPDDLEFWSMRDGNAYYLSETVERLWSRAGSKIGNCIIGDVSMESAGYVARYTTKKLYGDDAYLYDACNLTPPFLTMSLRPALGYSFFIDNLEKIFSDGAIFLTTASGGKRVPIPRYAYKLLERNNPDLYADVIARGLRNSELRKTNFKRLTKMPYPVILHNKLASLECRSKVLVRNKI